jgi:hypothetical protein
MMKAQIIAAAGLLFSSRAYAQQSLNEGSGFGTYYFDVEKIETCGTNFAAQNQGGVMCSHITSLPLTEINSNYVVAMNNTLLRGDMAKYCGKKVVVSVNGVASSLPLFIGDGCERCGTGPSTSDTWESTGAPGLDFSYSVLNELSGSACADGHIDISWEIVDETLYNFDTDGSGTTQGPASGGSSSGSSSSSSAEAKVATAAASSSASQESSSATQESSSATQESTSATQESTSASQEPASSASTSASSASQAVNSAADIAQAAVPTTMITQTAKVASTTSDAATTTYAPTATSGLVILATPTTSEPSAPCATGVWECNGDNLVQCLDGKWVTRAACVDGLSCQGGNSPYCAPVGFGKALSGN